MIWSVQRVPEFARIDSNIAIWRGYDPAVRAELYSTSLITAGGIYLIDPIPLERQALEELIGSSHVAGIIVTNSNHHRASTRFAEVFSVPIIAHVDTFSGEQPGQRRQVVDGNELCDELRVIGIDGAPPGEIALHYDGNGGTLIVGDALINFEPYGFALLPAKYCSNEREMRRSLRKLLDYEAKRILFAHGTPILSGASARLKGLLNSSL